MSEANPAQSVLIADVSGGDLLRGRLDEAEASRAVDRCLKRMERAVAVSGGQLVSSSDVRLTAAFDRPDQAFEAALQMQERVAGLPPVSGVKLSIRIGFTHGSAAADPGQLVGESAESAAQQRCGRLTLRYGDEELVLNERKPAIRMGRGAENDFAIHDRRASRQHAIVERRGERFVLTDSSSNGTYVTLDGKPELFLRGAECVIHGKGLICFAASASSPGVDCAEFEQS